MYARWWSTKSIIPLLHKWDNPWGLFLRDLRRSWVTCRNRSEMGIISVPDMQKRWACLLVCGLQTGQWTKCQRCLSTAQDWYVSGLLGRSQVVQHTGPAKWVLVTQNGRAWPGENSFHHKVWALWIHCHALWVGFCPQHIPKAMELIFRGVQCQTLVIYLRDLIIFRLLEYTEHFRCLDEVLTRLHEARLKLKPSKCELLQSEVLFLGHKWDKMRCKLILNW